MKIRIHRSPGRAVRRLDYGGGDGGDGGGGGGGGESLKVWCQQVLKTPGKHLVKAILELPSKVRQENCRDLCRN